MLVVIGSLIGGAAVVAVALEAIGSAAVLGALAYFIFTKAV